MIMMTIMSHDFFACGDDGSRKQVIYEDTVSFIEMVRAVDKD